jgi:hypothetical protein
MARPLGVRPEAWGEVRELGDAVEGPPSGVKGVGLVMSAAFASRKLHSTGVSEEIEPREDVAGEVAGVVASGSARSVESEQELHAAGSEENGGGAVFEALERGVRASAAEVQVQF